MVKKFFSKYFASWKPSIVILLVLLLGLWPTGNIIYDSIMLLIPLLHTVGFVLNYFAKSTSFKLSEKISRAYKPYLITSFLYIFISASLFLSSPPPLGTAPKIISLFYLLALYLLIISINLISLKYMTQENKAFYENKDSKTIIGTYKKKGDDSVYIISKNNRNNAFGISQLSKKSKGSQEYLEEVKVLSFNTEINPPITKTPDIITTFKNFLVLIQNNKNSNSTCVYIRNLFDSSHWSTLEIPYKLHKECVVHPQNHQYLTEKFPHVIDEIITIVNYKEFIMGVNFTGTAKAPQMVLTIADNKIHQVVNLKKRENQANLAITDPARIPISKKPSRYYSKVKCNSTPDTYSALTVYRIDNDNYNNPDSVPNKVICTLLSYKKNQSSQEYQQKDEMPAIIFEATESSICENILPVENGENLYCEKGLSVKTLGEDMHCMIAYDAKSIKVKNSITKLFKGKNNSKQVLIGIWHSDSTYQLPFKTTDLNSFDNNTEYFIEKNPHRDVTMTAYNNVVFIHDRHFQIIQPLDSIDNFHVIWEAHLERLKVYPNDNAQVSDNFISSTTKVKHPLTSQYEIKRHFRGDISNAFVHKSDASTSYKPYYDIWNNILNGIKECFSKENLPDLFPDSLITIIFSYTKFDPKNHLDFTTKISIIPYCKKSSDLKLDGSHNEEKCSQDETNKPKQIHYQSISSDLNILPLKQSFYL